MRPTYEFNRDPLDVADLPPGDGMALQYRMQTGVFRRRHWSFFFALRSISCLLAVIGVQFAGLFASSTLVVAVLALLGTLYACYRLWTRVWYDPTDRVTWYRVFWWVGAGAFLWLVVRFFSDAAETASTRLVLFVAAVILTAFVADLIATHHIMYLTAHPYVDAKTRKTWDAAWAARFNNPPKLRTPGVQRTALAGIGDYPLGFILIAVSLLVGIAASLPQAQSPFFGLYLFTAMFLSLLVLTVLWVTFAQEEPWRPFRLARYAIANWLSYDPVDSPAPGVFKSPAGTYYQRTGLTLLALFLLFAATVPFASYFPFAMLASDKADWVDAGAEPWPWEGLWQKPKTQSNAKPDPAKLSAHETRYLENLPPARQNAYRDKVLARNKAISESLPRKDAYTRLVGTPEGWLITAARGSLQARPTFIVALLIGLVTSLAGPTLLFLAVCLIATARVLTVPYDNLLPDAREERERRSFRSFSARDQANEPPDFTEWDGYVERIQHSPYETTWNSKDVKERDHLWLGINAEYGYPVLLDRNILHEHGHILGDSGSGKTALALAPMIAQLVRLAGINQHRQADDRPFSVLVIDLKGDRALFQGAREEAQRAGLPFKWFTNNRDHATYAFNPLLQPHIRNTLTVNQRTEVLIQALGLQYGEFYGAGYFSSINQTVLRRYLEHYSEEIDSFATLKERTDSPALYEATFAKETQRKRAQGKQVRATKSPRAQEEWKQAGHLMTRIDALASIPPLNITPANTPRPEVLANQIDLGAMLTTPQVVYFYLSSITETVAVQGIAKLALYALLTAADLAEPDQCGRVYVFIDEFQQIVAHNLELVLRQARSKNISVVLANQNITDLETPDGNLMHTVEANTAFKQIFRASSQFQRERLVASSGETVYHMFRWGENSEGRQTDTCTEEMGPRFRMNDIIETSYRENQSIVHISKPSGYTRYRGQMFALESDYHITGDEYSRRSRDSWPSCDDPQHPGTFVPATFEEDRSRKEAQEHVRLEHQETPPPPCRVSDMPPPGEAGGTHQPASNEFDDAIRRFKEGTGS